jgi:hypothetical protein
MHYATKLKAENESLKKTIDELTDVLTSARAIAERKGVDTAWERFSIRIGKLGIGSVTAREFKMLPSDYKY